AALFSSVALVGLLGRTVHGLIQRTPAQLSRYGPLFVLALWAMGHAALYMVSSVTPYLWYYLPLVPLLSTLIAIGIYAPASGLARLFTRSVEIGTRTRAIQLAFVTILFTFALLGPAASYRKIQAQLENPVEPIQPTLESKLLPEAKAIPYRVAGEWLAANTPSDATVGVTEVGILGYYSHRPMTDFLGLLDQDIARALAREDLAWGLYSRQPDYLVLSAVNPIFGFDVYRDPWFQGTYEPIHTVLGSGFWGGDLTIYQRSTPAPPQVGSVADLPHDLEPLRFRFGDLLELVGFSAPSSPWQPGEPTSLTLYWRVLKQPGENYTLFAHVWDEAQRLISARDGLPLLGERPMTTWQPGELLADYVPLGLPPMPLAPTTLHFGVGLYDSTTGERVPVFAPDGMPILHNEPLFGQRTLWPAAQPLLLSTQAYGGTEHMVLASYDLPHDGLTRGMTTLLQLDIPECSCPAELAIELWDPDSQRLVLQQAATLEAPGRLDIPLTPAASESAYRVDVRLRATKNGVPFFWQDATGHPLTDLVPLTPLFLSDP
ncbi:MAG: hypothetical protein M3220_14085, partial [Chloroflexota bacterium]|nr:hypothetical protein [Chloroflexota bacterium]